MVQYQKKLKDAHKAEITDCAELRKITITNCLIFFFQILQLPLLFVLF